VRVGFGLVFEQVADACGGEGSGLGGEYGLTRGVDALDVCDGLFVCFGFEEVGEFGELVVVELAEIEGGEGGVEEVLEERVCEFGFFVVRHASIFAQRRGGTSGKWSRAGSLRTGRVMWL